MSDASSRDRARRAAQAARLAALAASLLLALLLAAQWLGLAQRQSGFYDTLIYTDALRATLRDGQPLYGPAHHRLAADVRPRLPLAEAADFDLFFYPPPALPLLAWMAWPDALTVARLCALAQAALVAACVLWACRQAWPPGSGHRGRAGLASASAVLLALAGAPTWHLVTAGNLNALPLAAAVGFLVWQRDRPALAGGLLAAGIALKLYPAVLLLTAVAGGRHRAIGWTAGWLVLLTMLALPWVPWAEQRWYVRELMPWLGAHFDAQLGGQSLHAVLDRLAHWGEDHGLRGDLVRIAPGMGAVVTVVSIGLLGACALAAWRGRRSPARLRLVACLLLALVPCLSPKGHVHAFVFAIPLLAPLWVSMLRHPAWWPLGGLAAIAWLVPVWTGAAWLAEAPAALRELWYARLLILTGAGVALGLRQALGSATKPAGCQRQPPPGRGGLPTVPLPGIDAEGVARAGFRPPALPRHPPR